MSLNLQPNFSDADAFYAALADLHRAGDYGSVCRGKVAPHSGVIF